MARKAAIRLLPSGVPTGMKMPDLITWHGHTFARRTDERYSEASMWPIVEELDADPR